MYRALLFCVLGALLGVPAPAAPVPELLEFSAPPFLGGPAVSRSAFGVTYVYTGRPPYAASELQLTVVAIPEELGHDAARLPARCLGAFLDALRARDPTLALDSEQRESTLGDLAFVERRWLSQRGAQMRTGVTACSVHRGYFISVNFADALQTAAQSFPALRSALAGLILHF